MTSDNIVIVKYDASWPLAFEREKHLILGVLGSSVEKIEHFGSTSIPGACAKPIIDIMVGTRGYPPSEQYAFGLSQLAYEFRRVNAPWWHFFRKGMPRTHHLHLLDLDSEEGRRNWERQLLFRDYLRDQPKRLGRYVALKQELARRFAGDRSSYEEHKTDFVLETLEMAGALKERLENDEPGG